MALKLKITDGTNTLVDLSDGTYCAINESRGGYQEDQGSTVTVIPGDTSHDRIALLLVGGVSSIQTTYTNIQRALLDAERYENDRTGHPVYLEGSKDDGANWRRSRIRAGSCLYNVDEAIISGSANAVLEMDRVLGWLGPETAVPLTNPNGNRVSASNINVYNCNDGSGSAPNVRRNYVDIDGDDILGDLPAPSRIRIYNAYNTKFYLGLAFTPDITNLVSYVEGEDFTGVTPVSDAACSGGEYADITGWCTINRLYAAGAWLMPIARIAFPTAESSVFIGNTSILNPSGKTYHITRLSTAFHLYAFDPIRVPESAYVDVTWGGSTETIQIYSSDGAYVDYIQFLPVDRWRILEMIAIGLEPTGIADDLIEEITYASGTTAPIVATGPGLYLEPGKDQRISILAQAADGSTITDYWGVRMIYRPRYRTL